LLSVGNEYSVWILRDVISTVHDPCVVNDVSTPVGISSPYQAVNSMNSIPKPSFRWSLYKKIFWFPYFFFFSCFSHYFITYIDFTCIVASNTATGVVTNYVTFCSCCNQNWWKICRYWPFLRFNDWPTFLERQCI